MTAAKRKEERQPETAAQPVQLTPDQFKEFEKDFWFMMMSVETALTELRNARAQFYQFAQKYTGVSPIDMRFRAFASASSREELEQLECEHNNADSWLVATAKGRLFDLYCEEYSRLPAYLQHLLKAVEDKGAGAVLQVSKRASTYPAYLKLVERGFLVAGAETDATAIFTLKPELVPIVFDDDDTE